jgi:hypothetical protein
VLLLENCAVKLWLSLGFCQKFLRKPLELRLLKLSGVHNVFYVSQLKRCLKPPTDAVVEDTISLEPDLTYKTYPTKVLDQQDRVTRNKTTRFYKVR